jgi:hypothetical protein
MRQINLIALLFPTLFLWSCHRGNTLENVKEGIITYKINYLGEELPEAGKEFLPDKMVLMFNEHYSKTSIEGFMGVFDLSLITDLKNRESSTFIKVFDKKCMYTGQTGEYSCLFEYMGPLKTVSCDEIRNIAGYVTRCANVNYNDEQSNQFNIFYTQDIVVKNPNVNSPYENIDGVMLQFQMRFETITMVFTAEKVIRKNIPNKEFKYPEGYAVTSEEKMNKILSELLKI